MTRAKAPIAFGHVIVGRGQLPHGQERRGDEDGGAGLARRGCGGRDGLDVEVIERVYEDIERKRRAGEYLHAPPFSSPSSRADQPFEGVCTRPRISYGLIIRVVRSKGGPFDDSF